MEVSEKQVQQPVFFPHESHSAGAVRRYQLVNKGEKAYNRDSEKWEAAIVRQRHGK